MQLLAVQTLQSLCRCSVHDAAHVRPVHMSLVCVGTDHHLHSAVAVSWLIDLDQISKILQITVNVTVTLAGLQCHAVSLHLAAALALRISVETPFCPLRSMFSGCPGSDTQLLSECHNVKHEGSLHCCQQC